MVNLLTTNAPIICSANQLTGFYIMGTLVIKRLTKGIRTEDLLNLIFDIYHFYYKKLNKQINEAQFL